MSLAEEFTEWSLRAELEQVKGERDTLKAEVKRLTECLRKANEGFEEYERRYYFSRDAAEAFADIAQKAQRQLAAALAEREVLRDERDIRDAAEKEST